MTDLMTIVMVGVILVLEYFKIAANPPPKKWPATKVITRHLQKPWKHSEKGAARTAWFFQPHHRSPVAPDLLGSHSRANGNIASR